MTEPLDDPKDPQETLGYSPEDLEALRRVLAEMPEGGDELLGRLMPSAKPEWIRDQINTVDSPQPEAFSLFSPQVDATELHKFCTQFSDALGGVQLSVDEVSSTKFQTKEDWNNYAFAPGAIAYHALGKKVAPPLWRKLAAPAKDLSHALRPEHDPSKAPLRLGLFADFGNGLYPTKGIARQLAKAKLPYVFHLGDVYYGGSEKEFRDYFSTPLAPMIEHSEFFMLAGNHELYADGVHFQRYLQAKHAKYPALQRQNGEMFRLVGKGLQIIGIDTMWTEWEGNGPRVYAHLGAKEKAVLKEWLKDVGPNTLTVLMTSDHPWDLGSSSLTPLHKEFEEFVKQGQIDLWFWGNVHYAALYLPWQTPGNFKPGFVGSCIGHGGYPFYTQKNDTLPDRVGLAWLEKQHRFAPFKKVRPDVGMNGWCEMEVRRDNASWAVKLRYLDWVGRESHVTTLTKADGRGILIDNV